MDHETDQQGAPSSGRGPQLPRLIAPENRAFERHLRSYAARHSQALLRNWEFEQVGDPIEAVHDLRVASRRLRALIEVLGHLTSDHEATRKLLRGVTRGAGPLREWDVNAQHLAELLERPSSHLEAASLEYVGVLIDAERSKETRRARKALGKISTEKLQRRLYDLVEELVRAILVTPLPELGRAVLEPKVDALLASLPHGTDPGLGEQLHVVRIQIKRLRYAVELLQPLLGSGYGAVHAQLKALQQDLGRHHDLFVLQQVMLGARSELEAGGRKHLVLGLAGPLHHLAAEQRQLAAEFLEGSASFSGEAFREQLVHALGASS